MRAGEHCVVHHSSAPTQSAYDVRKCLVTSPWGAGGRRFKSCQPDVVTGTYGWSQSFVPTVARQSARFGTWLHALIARWTRRWMRLSVERWVIFG